ncbi:hypothetical protein LZ32DRAFT_650200, partial [Colletotrichum eremochloae]
MMRGTLPETQTKYGRFGQFRRFVTGGDVLTVHSARTENPNRAIHHLTAYSYWIFDDTSYAIRRGTPPPFMPGNAELHSAVEYMVAGWKGSEGDAAGFPNDGG